MGNQDNSPQINDLIFKELIKRGYSLEGNTRVWNIADSKLWYLRPDQAQAFLDLESSKVYQEEIIQKEINLISKNIDEIFGRFGEEPLNVIDLGCGDGKKAVLFIEKFKGKRIRYCPVDISSYMVNKAIDKISRLSNVEEVVEFQWNISDFENLENITFLLRQGEYSKNLILLLGNTLGNFEINELLYEIRSSMKEGDFLLIGNGLNNEDQESILSSYRDPAQDNFLEKIPRQLGLDKDEVEYNVRFKNSRVEAFYTIKKDKVIEFQRKKVTFNKGDQIIVAVSYKYNESEFVSFLNLYFDEVTARVSDDKSYALALCKK